MSFTIKPESGANWGQVQQRFNKTAKDSNVIKLKGGIFEGCEGYEQEINLQYTVSGAGAQIAWQQLTALDQTIRYYQITVNDGEGNYKSIILDPANVTAAVNMNTSGLDASKDWKAIIGVSTSSPVATEGDCENNFEALIGNPAGNPTDTLDTRDTIGTLSLAVNGTTVADGGSIALAAAAVGDVVLVRLTLSETAGSIVQVSGFTVSGDGSFPEKNSPYLPFKLAPNGSVQSIAVLMDTATAGSKTASLVITSNDTASPYNVDITLTVA